MTDADTDPRPPLPEPAGQPARCASCDAPLLPDQRYCLECGVRRGAPRLDFTGFWRRRGDGAAGTADAASAGGGAPRRGPLPSRKATAALACVILAAGIAAGDLIGPGPATSLASGAYSLPIGVLGAIAAAESTHKDKSTATRQATESPQEVGPPASGSFPEAEAPAKAEAKSEATEEATEEVAETTGSETSSTTKAKAPKQSATETPVSSTVLAEIQHVWVITLSGSSFQRALAKPSSDPYLAKRLAPEGTLLSNYSLVAASPLANDIALLSGQGGNSATEEDCPTYEPIEPPTVEAKGLTEGVGCIYPAAAKTLADQAGEAALTWKAYVQDVVSGETSATFTQTTTTTTTSTTGSDTTTSATTTSTAGSDTTTSAETAAGQATSTAAASAGAASTQACRHPAVGGSEPAQTPVAGAGYLLYRNPFVFFDSLLESGACGADDVGLAALKPDLAEAKDTPNLNWIVPSACDDGQATKCGRAGSSGLTAADDFLDEVVPEITASGAYKQHGLILITFDAGPAKHAEAGAKVGALLVSPFVKRGTDARSFDTYSLLKSIERIYGVPLLGHANDEGLEALGAGVYSATAKAAQAAASSRHGAMQPSG